MKGFLKSLGKRLGQIARNPVVRPIEVWALRAVLGLIAVKLGIDVKSLVR